MNNIVLMLTLLFSALSQSYIHATKRNPLVDDLSNTFAEMGIDFAKVAEVAERPIDKPSRKPQDDWENGHSRPPRASANHAETAQKNPFVPTQPEKAKPATGRRPQPPIRSTDNPIIQQFKVLTRYERCHHRKVSRTKVCEYEELIRANLDNSFAYASQKVSFGQNTYCVVLVPCFEFGRHYKRELAEFFKFHPSNRLLAECMRHCIDANRYVALSDILQRYPDALYYPNVDGFLPLQYAAIQGKWLMVVKMLRYICTPYLLTSQARQNLNDALRDLDKVLNLKAQRPTQKTALTYAQEWYTRVTEPQDREQARLLVEILSCPENSYAAAKASCGLEYKPHTPLVVE